MLDYSISATIFFAVLLIFCLSTIYRVMQADDGYVELGELMGDVIQSIGWFIRKMLHVSYLWRYHPKPVIAAGKLHLKDLIRRVSP